MLDGTVNAGTKMDGIRNQADNDLLEKYCYDNDDDNCNIYGFVSMG